MNEVCPNKKQHTAFLNVPYFCPTTENRRMAFLSFMAQLWRKKS